MTDAVSSLGVFPDWPVVRDALLATPERLRADAPLMEALGVRPAASNLVEFGPAALARVSALHRQEAETRQALEATARANFAAQAQTHAAVIDLLDSRNVSDLARRVDETATLRFGLTAGVLAVEGRAPAGWRGLREGDVDQVLGADALMVLGPAGPDAAALFADRIERTPGHKAASVAMVRLSIWGPPRQGVLAFAHPDADGFTRDMGGELISFLARVVERTAERWPLL